MNYTKIGAMLMMLIMIVGAATATKVVPTDASGTEVRTFTIGDNIYAIGSGFAAGDECQVYAFENGNWQYATGWGVSGTGSYNIFIYDDLPLAKAVAGPVDVTMAGDGTFSTTLVWANADQTGDFDIVVDCATAGKWDGIPSGDGVTQYSCVGFTVVPESVIAVGLIALFVPGMIYIARKRKQ